MPNFQTVPDYYTPTHFTTADYQIYQIKQPELEKTRAELNEQIQAQQSDLKLIIHATLQWIRDYNMLEQRIFYMSSDLSLTAEGTFPCKRMQREFTDLLDDDVISPHQILAIFRSTMNEYKTNELPYGADIQFQMQYGAIVSNAHQVGNQFEQKYNQLVIQLQPYCETLASQQRAINAKETQLLQMAPKAKLQQYFIVAYKVALEKIRQDADQKSGGLREACGIRGLCRDLAKLDYCPTEEELEHRIGEYATLADRSENGYAATQISRLKRIIKAHTENLALLDQPDFETNLLLEFLEPAIEAPQHTNYSFYLKCLAAGIGALFLLLSAPSHPIISTVTAVVSVASYYCFFHTNAGNKGADDIFHQPPDPNAQQLQL
ncbi:TPA: hypothetical protein ACPSKB_000047 [Legionella feeleii]